MSMPADIQAQGEPTVSAEFDIVANFGAKVREIRLAKHLTQEDVAGRVGLQRTTISALENGDGAPPRLDLLMSLARALGVAPATLLPPGPPAPPTPWEVVARRLRLSYA